MIEGGAVRSGARGGILGDAKCVEVGVTVTDRGGGGKTLKVGVCNVVCCGIPGDDGFS